MDHAQHLHDAAALIDASPVRVVAWRDGRQVVLLVHGEVDVDSCDHLRSVLMSALRGEPESVRVDVSDLLFCDLAGSDVLHHFADEATARAIPVDLRGMSPLLTMMYTGFPPRQTSHAQERRLPDMADV